MNTQFCKVGTVRSTLSIVEESIEIENNAIESKAKKTKPSSKSK